MRHCCLSTRCLLLLIESTQQSFQFCMDERQYNTWHWFTTFSLKAFSFKDFCLWLNKVLMEGDNSVRLAQRDFPFYCHVKVICYMPQSQFQSTCDIHRIVHVEMPQNGFSSWWEWDDQSKHLGGKQNQSQLKWTQAVIVAK